MSINVICPHCTHVHSSETAYLCDSEGCLCPAGSVITYREAERHPPTDPKANADEARDWQGEWERDVADSGDLR